MNNIEYIINKLNIAYPKSIHLLKPIWKLENIKTGISSTGFCYNAAECAYYILGGKVNGWKPFCATYYENGFKNTHWWIKHKNGNICDPTYNQYTDLGECPPYKIGKHRSFLTNFMSNRSKELLKIAGLNCNG